MNEYIKTDEQLNIMRKAGQILACTMKKIEDAIKPGIDVFDLEELFLREIEAAGATPACKNYAPYGLPPFPTGLCISINEQSVHCYPTKGSLLKEGDIITVDSSIEYQGWHADMAFAKGVGKIDEKKQKLLDTAKAARDESIKKVKAGIRTGVISNKMHKTAKKAGFDVLKDYAGHGIGKAMHEWPEISCYGPKHQGVKLKENMAICIEALVCTDSDVVVNTDEWQTKMKDGYFAQFEHTVLVKKGGYEILTLCQN